MVTPAWPDANLYDRIIAWATPHVLPRDWVDQAAPDAVVVTSVKLAALAWPTRCCAATSTTASPASRPCILAA